MIVRCTSCVSAFAVDDEKVANRKFAFTCPKCGTENIFDNRKSKEKPLPDNLFFEQESPEPQGKPSGEDMTFEQDLGSNETFFEEEPSTPERAEKKGINLEIEEAADKEEIFFEDEEFFAEEKPEKEPAPAEEEILFEDEEFFAEEKPEKEPAPAEEEILLEDEELFAEEKPEEELSDIGLELEEESFKAPAGDRELKVTSQDDIDALFAGLPSEEEIHSAESDRKHRAADEDDITVNLDELDIELEDEIKSPEVESAPEKKYQEEEVLFDEDISIDMDSLDIDIEEAGDIHRPKTVSLSEEQRPKRGLVDEDEFVLNIDEFEEDFETVDKIKAERGKEKEIFPDEDITLDLESLDIDLDEGEEHIPAEKAGRALAEADDEELKLNLDELDVNIEELENREPFSDEEIFKNKKEKLKKAPLHMEEEEEDESITIDLDTLDIEVAETPEVMAGEITEEDEKITLDDAGITFNELTDYEKKPEPAEITDEELNLTLEEIDPELKLQVIGEEAPADEKLLIDTVEELPEIDLEEYEAVIRKEEFISEKHEEETIVGLDEFEIPHIDEESHRPLNVDILDYEEAIEEGYIPTSGSTTFSIDYSLRYSRTGALLRLIGLYILSMIPHFIVMLIYTILSGILGFINQIVIIFTGRCIEDFSQITENTLRYFFYIKSNIAGIVEDRPVYAGRESINHQMQLNITYPVKYSKNLAILRLSIIGICLITLPHFAIMAMLTIAVPFVYLAGIITVIFTRRWPNPLFIFLTRYFRYLARISSFLLGLTDEYPPFRFN